MRDGANLAGNLFHQIGIFGNRSRRLGIELLGLRLHDADVHADRGQQLADAIVQFAGDALALLILHVLKARGKLRLLLLARSGR